MRMVQACPLCVVPLLAFVLSSSASPPEDEREPFVSEISQDCLVCHMEIHPGMVADWRRSRHARISPEMAMKKPALERRVSSDTIPDELLSVVVGCYECHGLNTDKHADTFDHFGYKVQVVVSPEDCKTCHAVEAEQFASGKKAHALDNLEKNPIFHQLVETVTTVREWDGERLRHLEASDVTKNETCYACHGSRVTATGKKKIVTELGAIEIPVLSNWPNQGVGRVNPDGSTGACTACHPRHEFSIEIARKPYTCSQCHLHPEVPAWDVYVESKHGNIARSKQHEWDWNRVPWRVGEDFGAPTCAVCHVSLLVSPKGDAIAARSHDFGARLWTRIFGLPYTHPQPKTGATHLIRNKDGQPLPTTFAGEPASEFLIGSEEQTRRRNEMRKICRSCHAGDWVDGHLRQLDETILQTDRMVLASTKIMQKAWKDGTADPENPFDEPLEHRWLEQWLFHANSIRYAAAMSGADYATFKNGWWNLTKNLREMESAVEKTK